MAASFADPICLDNGTDLLERFVGNGDLLVVVKLDTLHQFLLSYADVWTSVRQRSRKSGASMQTMAIACSSRSRFTLSKSFGGMLSLRYCQSLSSVNARSVTG